MYLFEFISSIIESLIWPLVVFIIVIILREPISKLISSVDRLNYKELEINFSEELDKVENKAFEKNKYSKATIVSEVEGDDYLHNLKLKKVKIIANEDPSLAIIYSWIELEVQLREKYEKNGFVHPAGSIIAGVNFLVNNDKLEPFYRDIIVELNSLRNKAVHNGGSVSISLDDAIRYFELSNEVLDRVSKI